MLMFVEASVNWNVVPGKFLFWKWLPVAGLTVKEALGARQKGVGLGVGVGPAVGVGVWLDPGLGGGVGAGVAVGLGVGVGVGAAVGVGVGIGLVGWLAICIETVVENETAVPPVKTASTGVRSVNRPRTVTATVFPSAPVHVGVQARETSDEVTVTGEPRDSLMARHTTRFETLSHGWPAANDVGLIDASKAPSRAAFEIAIRE